MKIIIVIFSVNAYFQPLFILFNDINNSVFRYSIPELYMSIYCRYSTVWNVLVVPLDFQTDLILELIWLLNIHQGYESALLTDTVSSTLFLKYHNALKQSVLSFSSRPFDLNMVKCRTINIARFAL